MDATVVGAARLRLDFERAHEAEKKAINADETTSEEERKIQMIAGFLCKKDINQICLLNTRMLVPLLLGSTISGSSRVEKGDGHVIKWSLNLGQRLRQICAFRASTA